MTPNFYRIVLLPPPEIGDKLTQLSQELCGKHQNYTLGVNSVPHLTVCSFKGTQAEAESVWSQLQALLTPALTADIFYSALQKATGYIYFALNVKLTDEVMAFQKKVMEIAGPQSSSEIGLSYRPHYTLGCFFPSDNASVDLSKATNPLPTHNVRLAMGLSSPFGPVPEIVFE